MARHLDAEGERLVVIGLMQPNAGAWRHTDLAHWHDAEHQRAGRVADAVDDNTLADFRDALVLRLVFLYIAAVIARNAQIRLRGRAERERHKQDRQMCNAHRNCRWMTVRTETEKHHNSGGTVLENR